MATSTKGSSLLSRLHRRFARAHFGRAHKIVVGVVGVTVVILGIAMLVLPGPGLLVIPLGLGILASEFLWARRLLEKAKAAVPRKVMQRVQTKRRR